jgi:hypothetical protein
VGSFLGADLGEPLGDGGGETSVFEVVYAELGEGILVEGGFEVLETSRADRRQQEARERLR